MGYCHNPCLASAPNTEPGIFAVSHRPTPYPNKCARCAVKQCWSPSAQHRGRRSPHSAEFMVESIEGGGTRACVWRDVVGGTNHLQQSKDAFRKPASSFNFTGHVKFKFLDLAITQTRVHSLFKINIETKTKYKYFYWQNNARTEIPPQTKTYCTIVLIITSSFTISNILTKVQVKNHCVKNVKLIEHNIQNIYHNSIKLFLTWACARGMDIN